MTHRSRSRRAPVRRTLLLAVPALLTVPVLLAGCGSSTSTAGTRPDAATSSVAPSSVPPSAAAGMSGMPGMSMPGMSMPASSAPAAGSADGGPTETAVMVCGGRVADAIAQALSLDAPPATSSSWTAPVFTCTYRLPMGPLVLTVQVAPDKAAAGTAFDADRTRRGETTTLPGLGERAFGTPAGVTEVVKDAQVLTVDATGLPEVFGTDDQHRTDFADEVAAAVMGCWIAHG